MAEKERFTLGPVIGEGGMAKVFEGIDTELGRSVAVKCIRPDYVGDEGLRQRFTDEARIMGSLGHPGMVPVYAIGVLEDGGPFYAMKRVSGKTLHELLHRRSFEDIRDPSTLQRFVDVFEKVCQTVAAAHAENVIHRDIKPDNVMVDDFGAVYVMDWGLAKRLGTPGPQRTADGAVMGTPAYMSPELAAGKTREHDTRSDVFSLGILLYEILTGVQPFRGRDAKSAVLHRDPEPPRKQNPAAPRELIAVCLKALNKDPELRYESAREMADDIRRFREYLPVTACKRSMVERVRAWSRRRPALAAACATAAVGLLVVGGAIGFQLSVERHMVGEAYEVLDFYEEELESLEEQIDDVRARRSNVGSGDPRRAALDRELRDLRAQREVREEAVRAAAFAISGMTLFGSGSRALGTAREDMLIGIEIAMADEEWYRARALLADLLAGYERRNWLQFTAADQAGLKKRLTRVEREIAKLESP